MLATVVLGMPLVTAGDAAAHAFGARYDLPLPLDLYLVGAGLVVLVTFVVAGFFLGPGSRPVATAHLDFPLAKPFWVSAAIWLRHFGLVFGLAIFFLVLATAFFGNKSPTRNFAPTFVWVIWWVGMVYLAALITNLWPWLSPWGSLSSILERLRGGRAARFSYPQALGYWPAVALLFAFAWIEMVLEAGDQPRVLGTLILAYTLLTLAGALFFGARAWLVQAEVFSVAFSVFGRFAPLRFDKDGLRLRPFAGGLLSERAPPASLMVFIVLMVATVTFDGFVETPAWSGILDWIVVDTTLRPLLLMLRGAGVDLLAAIKTCALLVFPLAFLCIYLVFCRLVRLATGSQLTTLAIACTFVFSLVPIAIAYHLAHYYSFLLLAGQLIIALVSDPFGFGWNLFGTAGHTIDITVVSAKTTWYLAVVAIVTGHVIAVLLGHLTALRLFPSHRAALLSQVPMTVLMIGYTMVSLWILSQPIVQEPVF